MKTLKQHSARRMVQSARIENRETSTFIALMLLTLLFPISVYSAETVNLRHIQSIYFDEKGVGMKQPEGVACNEKSLLIVGDTGNGRLLRYSYQDRSLKAGSEIKVEQLSNPIRLQINSKGGDFCTGWEETANHPIES